MVLGVLSGRGEGCGSACEAVQGGTVPSVGAVVCASCAGLGLGVAVSPSVSTERELLTLNETATPEKPVKKTDTKF